MVKYVEKTCPICHGRRNVKDPRTNETRQCPNCGGKGRITVKISGYEQTVVWRKK